MISHISYQNICREGNSIVYQYESDASVVYILSKSYKPYKLSFSTGNSFDYVCCNRKEELDG